jgi:Cu-Zn family superoxide dismutase
VFFILPAVAADNSPQTATASIIFATGEKIGSASFTQTPRGGRIQLDVSGLPAGEHAVHIHQVGKCDAPEKFATAGGHFNPTGKTHGSMSEHPEHGGDMPNQKADSKGVMRIAMLNGNVSLASLFDADGSAIVVHAMADDYKSQRAVMPVTGSPAA